MTCYNSWRQAVLLSICIHCIVFAAIGVFSIFNRTDELSTDYIEMELVSDPAVPLTSTTQSIEQAQPFPTQVSTPPQMGTPGREQSNLASGIIGEAGDHEVQTASTGYSSISGESLSNARTEQSFRDTIGTESSTRKKSEILPPRILRRVEPSYPEQARMEGWEGTVLIRVEVLSNGLPGSITVRKSSGHPLLDDAAIKAMENWLFAPAEDTATGMPEVCYTNVPLTFRLN